MSVSLEELLAFASRNLLLSVALAGLTAAIIWVEVSRLFRGYKSLRPGELAALVNREDALVVDLSPINDYQKGHIAGSKSVQPSQFDPENKLLAKARSLPVVVVCGNGMAANSAARRLVKAGFERVHVLEGGIQAWRSADLPLVKGRG